MEVQEEVRHGSPELPTTLALVKVAGFATAALVANLYYAQPLAARIAVDLDIGHRFAGGIVSASQFGYALGLFLIVPLADTVETRRLVLACGGLSVTALIGLAVSPNAIVFLFCALMTGFFSSGAQVLIPFLSRVLPPDSRGGALGAIMAGVLATVMLARPAALFVTAAAGWRSVFWIAALAVTASSVGLARTMTVHRPRESMTYRRTVMSMFILFAADRRVQRRTFCQALIFASFTMFWSTAPILLSERFGLDTVGLGVFALVGAGGALAAPLAGRLADRGHARTGTLSALLTLIAAFAVSVRVVDRGLLIPLAFIAIVIDGAVQASQTFSRLAILEVEPGIRGRINALYMTLVYTAGAIGSIAGVYIQASLGWRGVALTGAALAFIAFCRSAGELFDEGRKDVRAI